MEAEPPFKKYFKLNEISVNYGSSLHNVMAELVLIAGNVEAVGQGITYFRLPDKKQ